MWIGRGLQNTGERLVRAPLEHAYADHALRHRKHDGCRQRQEEQDNDDLAHLFADARGGLGFPTDIKLLRWVHVAEGAVGRLCVVESSASSRRRLLSISAGSARVPA